MDAFVTLRDAARKMAGREASDDAVMTWLALLIAQADHLHVVKSRRSSPCLPGGVVFEAAPEEWVIPSPAFDAWSEAHGYGPRFSQGEHKPEAPASSPLKARAPDTGEKPMSTKERNTLLTIIAALCDYSAISHQDRGASGKIAKLTEELGAPVTDDTIRKVLARIPNALETREK